MKPGDDVLRFVRPNILALTPYSTARDECKGDGIRVYLDANESPFATGFNRYPDPRHVDLRGKVGRMRGLTAANVFLAGAGSDEAIDLIYRIFCVPGRDNAVAVSPTYGVYSVAAQINDVEYREVPAAPGCALPVDAMLAAADSRTRVMWVCTPDNPTGRAVPLADIERLASGFDGILAVDEAYIDFSTVPSATCLIARHPNVIVLQTFSKAWGLAALRVGMAFCDAALAAIMAKVKYPYNLSTPTMDEVSRQLDGRDLRPQVQLIIAERERLRRTLEGLPCVECVYPSDANFLLVRVKDAAGLYGWLVSRGVLVRSRHTTPQCEGCLRITVGTPDDNRRLFEALYAYCGMEPPVPGTAGAGEREATVHRRTAETDITVHVDLGGDPLSSHIDTGLRFFDHMLSQLPHHGGIRVDIVSRGDLDVDQHHTMEDVAIALGEALSKALGDKRGIERYGFTLPMDEAEARVLIDLGGRFDFSWDVVLHRETVGDTPTEMYPHFFQSLASSLRANLHIHAGGLNDHHIIEGIFKATARALRMAVRRTPGDDSLPSSKGTL